MKEVKLSGHPIKSYSTEALTNLLGQYRVTKWIDLILIAVTVGLICISGPDALEEFEEMLLLMLGLPVLFVILAINAIRSEMKIKKELKRRATDNSKLTQMNADAKQSTKGLLIVIACLMVAAVIVGIAVGLISNIPGSEAKTACKNCGRTDDIVPGFEYCEDCYDGFVDWQEDNWKD